MKVSDAILRLRKWKVTDCAWFATGALTLLFSISALVPWRPYIVRSSDLDDSWVLAINAMSANGLQFGRDVVFTYGPWGFLDTRSYYPATYGRMVLGWMLIALVLWGVCWVMARRYVARPAFAFIWLLATLGCASVVVVVENSALLFLPPLLLVYYFHKNRQPMSITFALLLAAIALASLVKFSYFLMAVLVLVPIAIDQVRRRQLPSAAFLFGGFFVTLFLLAGQRIGSLWPYLRTSWHMASRYTDAMSYTIWFRRHHRLHLSQTFPPPDLLAFLLAASLVVAIIVFAEVRRRKWGSVLPLAALLGLTFMIFKWGYVRHSGDHASLATLALLGLMLLYLLPLRESLPGRRWGWRLTGVLVTTIAVSWATLRFGTGTGLLTYVAELVAEVPVNAASAIRLSLVGASPVRAEYGAALAEIRRNAPVPPIHSTVDVYPWNQAVAIAYDLHYDPRPVLQSYCAYSPELAQINADHLRGPQAPDTILFDVVASAFMENYPPADDGPSWPELLTRYDIRRASSTFLVLDKSRRPRTYTLAPVLEVDAALGAAVRVPTIEQGPIWVQIAIQRTWAGKLLSLVYKSPELLMTMTSRNGQERTYRLIAGQAESGFLLSPMVLDRKSFAALASPDWRAHLGEAEVKSIRLTDQGCVGTKWAYRANLSISFYRLRLPA